MITSQSLPEIGPRYGAEPPGPGLFSLHDLYTDSPKAQRKTSTLNPNRKSKNSTHSPKSVVPETDADNKSDKEGTVRISFDEQKSLAAGYGFSYKRRMLKERQQREGSQIPKSCNDRQGKRKKAVAGTDKARINHAANTLICMFIRYRKQKGITKKVKSEHSAARVVLSLLGIVKAKRIAKRARERLSQLQDSGRTMYEEIQNDTVQSTVLKPRQLRRGSLFSKNKFISSASGKKMLVRMSAYEEESTGKMKVALMKYRTGAEITVDADSFDNQTDEESAGSPVTRARRLVAAVESGIPETAENQYTHFLNHHDLASTMQRCGIDTELYGKGSTKTIQMLCDEINAGLCHLEEFGDQYSKQGMNSRLLRVVNVVNVVLKRKGKVLIEAARTLPNGTRKGKNGRCPSQKMNLPQRSMSRADGVKSCAEGCLGMNLNIPMSVIGINKDNIKTSSDLRNSEAFPMLKSKYYIHVVEADIDEKQIDELLSPGPYQIAISQMDKQQRDVLVGLMSGSKAFDTREHDYSTNGDVIHHWDWKPAPTPTIERTSTGLDTAAGAVAVDVAANTLPALTNVTAKPTVAAEERLQQSKNMLGDIRKGSFKNRSDKCSSANRNRTAVPLPVTRIQTITAIAEPKSIVISESDDDTVLLEIAGRASRKLNSRQMMGAARSSVVGSIRSTY